MDGSFPFDSNGDKLFEFHFSDTPAFHLNQSVEVTPSIFQQPSKPYYAYYSDATPTTHKKDNDLFASPTLKPKTSTFQRKRFKSVASNDDVSSQGSNTPEKKMESENKDDDSSDDGEGSDSDSNQDGSEANNKRGKYKIYSDNEKSTIMNFMMKHGMQKTLEIFSGSAHKITKRKLKSWIENQYKVKGVKGRKTNDPNRDQTLYDWCLEFQKETGRPPTRKEATKKALELSEDPSFQASKGWLDKFSRKFQIDFTPLKIIPPKHRKKVDGFLLDSDSGSALSGSDSPAEGISPLLPGMQTIQPHHLQQRQFQHQPHIQHQPQQQNQGKPWMLESAVNQNGFHQEQDPYGSKVSSFFNYPNQGQNQNQNQNQNYNHNHNNYHYGHNNNQNHNHNHNPNQGYNNNGYGGMNGMNYENKDTVPYLEQNHYQPQSMPNDNYFNYAFPTNYQQPYQMNFQVKPEENFQLDLIPNNQMHSDVGNYFNSGTNFDPDNYMNEQMKMEHPY